MPRRKIVVIQNDSVWNNYPEESTHLAPLPPAATPQVESVLYFRFKYEKCVSFDLSRWEKALEQEREKRERERLRLLEGTRAALRGYFQNKRVSKAYLTSSILQRGRFYPFSDVDIAVEGLKENYLETLAGLEAILEREVDLIELEECRFRDSIQKRGMQIL